MRVYRPGRRTRVEVEAEWAWVEALSPHVPTAAPVEGLDGRHVQVLEVPGGRRFAVAMEWLDGGRPDRDDPRHRQRQGELVRQLRAAAERVSVEQPDTWVGWQRPRLDVRCLIDQPAHALCEADFVDPAQSERCRVLARRLREGWSSWGLGCDAFVHHDLHTSNILIVGDRFYAIDFDDSGLGPPELELATPRMWLRARGRLHLWPELLRGYGLPVDDARQRFVTALKTFHMAGAFPSHLDIPLIGADPPGIVDRYLGYVEQELAGS